MHESLPSGGGHVLDEYDAPRFWSHVDFHGGFAFLNDPLARVTEDDGECWVWTGWERNRYPHFTLAGKRVAAHRLAYRDFNNRLPDELDVDHLCRNTMCVRPNHLEAVTEGENVRRGLNPLTNRSECSRGHALTPDNIKTYRTAAGEIRRNCKTCRREDAAAYSQRRRSAAS